jgi:hypothetical protein
VKPGLVKPETALFLEKSHELLERADTMMGVGLTDDGGRAAYLAGLHAAQAFIFETTGRVFKKTFRRPEGIFAAGERRSAR